MTLNYAFIETTNGANKATIKKDMIFRMARIIQENNRVFAKYELSWSDACKQAWHNAKEEQRKLNNLLTKNVKSEPIQGDFSNDRDFRGNKYKNVN